MAEEKKPKIDLKARLGKKDAGATPAPAPAAAPSAGGLPPPDVGTPVAPPTPRPTPGLPVPPGIPVGPAPAFDASNPLAAAVAPRPAPAPAHPPQQMSTRIEVDEMAVQEAAKKARRGGFVIAAIGSILFAGVGFVGGQSYQQGADRQKAHVDAQELKAAIDKSRGELDSIAQKVDAGRALLTAKDPKDRKFPDTLDDELTTIIVEFDGTMLAGRRFSGFPQDVSKNLFDYVALVAALNDHKTALKNLLTKLEKPLKESLAASASGTHAVQQIVLLGGPVGKDNGGNYVGNLATLAPPLSFTGDHPDIKDDFKATFQGNNITVSPYKGGNLDKPAAVYVVGPSFDAVCPSDTKSQAAQLGFKLQDILTEIKGEGPAPEGQVVDSKPGLIERADTLSKALEKI